MLRLKYIPQIYTIKQMQYRFVVDFGTLMFACRCVPLGGCEDTADGVAANCVRSDRLRFIQFTWPNYGGRQILFFPSSLFSQRERDNRVHPGAVEPAIIVLGSRSDFWRSSGNRGFEKLAPDLVWKSGPKIHLKICSNHTFNRYMLTLVMIK